MIVLSTVIKQWFVNSEYQYIGVYLQTAFGTFLEIPKGLFPPNGMAKARAYAKQIEGSEIALSPNLFRLGDYA